MLPASSKRPHTAPPEAPPPPPLPGAGGGPFAQVCFVVIKYAYLGVGQALQNVLPWRGARVRARACSFGAAAVLSLLLFWRCCFGAADSLFMRCCPHKINTEHSSAARPTTPSSSTATTPAAPAARCVYVLCGAEGRGLGPLAPPSRVWHYLRLGLHQRSAAA
jgi:hypothetical protein